MKKIAFYIALLSGYAIFFVLACTKTYDNPKAPPSTTNSSNNASSSSSSASSSSNSSTSSSSSSSSSSTTTGAPCSPATNTTETTVFGTQSYSNIFGIGSINQYIISCNDNNNPPFFGFSFSGINLPAAGVYTPKIIAANSSEVGVSYSNDGVNNFVPDLSNLGKVYVDVSGSTLTITACDIKMIIFLGTDTLTLVQAKIIKP